jgi:hypothetical protein
MRNRFGLPADERSSTPACGGGTAADYAKWLLCALAQEVRTGNFYDVEGDVLYVREEGDDGGKGKPAIAPLETENAIRGRAPWSPFLNFLKIDMFMFQKILN